LGFFYDTRTFLPLKLLVPDFGVCDDEYLRERLKRKLQKQLRRMEHKDKAFVAKLRKYSQTGTPFVEALRRLMLDSGADWQDRAAAARMFALADAKGAVADLLDQFFTQSDKTELWVTALTVESLGARSAIRPLITALSDSNPHRRHAAARALGWIPNAGSRAANALIEVLSDKSQPLAVREEAAESLAYSRCARAIAPLITALDDNQTGVRFWSVFALGSISRHQRAENNQQAVEALEKMLRDEEKPPGAWWSVGREALAMLGDLRPEYHERVAAETARVLHDQNSTPEDRFWAEGYASTPGQ
jgi:HEAT repeat protein